MTRKEAENWLNKLYARADITDEYGDMEDMQPYEEAVNMAIKALQDKGHDRKKARRFKNKYLKLKTAIGKIKAEIESCRNMYFKNHDGTISPYMNGTIDSILQIINKRIAESEGKK